MKVLQQLRVQSKRDFVRKLMKSLVKQKFIKDVQKKLQSYQELLDTAILVNLDARSIRQSDDFESLSQEIKGLALALANGQSTFKQLVQDDGILTRNHIDHEMQSTRDLIVEESNRRLLRVEHESLLQSLFYPEITVRQENISEPYNGTCEWLFKAEEEDFTTEPWLEDRHLREGNRIASRNFVMWLREDKDIFWITGKAGAGKSTLMKHLFNHHRTRDELSVWSGSNGHSVVLAGFFLWNRGTNLQKSLLGMLRSVLHQIISQTPSLTSILTSRQGRPGTYSNTNFTFTGAQEWTIAGLLEAFRCLLASLPPQNYICVFLDGLDELESRTQDLLAFIASLKESPRVKLCVSSRPEQVFRNAFKDTLQVRMQDLNRYDIDHAAGGRLLLPLITSHPENHEDVKHLIREISEKAEGVFLWANIVVEDIRKGIENDDTLEMLQKRLDILPSSIEDLYHHMLTSVSDLYWSEAATYFCLLLMPRFAGCTYVEPLTLLDLAFMHDNDEVLNKIKNQGAHFGRSESFAKICARHETRIHACCAGLVEVSKRPGDSITRPLLAVRALKGDGYISWGLLGPSSWDDSPACYCLQEVSFIHRTIAEFLTAHLNEFFKDPSWNVGATNRLLKCKLGRVELLPVLCDGPEPTEYAVETLSLLSAIPLKRLDVPILIMGHIVFSIMDHVLTLDDRSDRLVQHWVSELSQTMARVKHAFRGDGDLWYENCIGFRPGRTLDYPIPFNDWAGMSAYYGLFGAIQCWISSGQHSTQRLPYLIQCAIQGRWMFLTSNDDQPKAFKNLVFLWLEHGGNLNAPVNFPEHLMDYPPHIFVKSLTHILRRRESLWAVFVENAVEAILYNIFARKSVLLEITRAFLEAGADPNAKVFSYYCILTDTVELYTYIEETIISFLERSACMPALSEIGVTWLHKFCEIVLARQGYRYRRCHFLRFDKRYDPDLSIEGLRKYTIRLFTITKEQSDRFYSRWDAENREMSPDEAIEELLSTLDDEAEITEEKFYQMWEKRHEPHGNDTPDEHLEVNEGAEGSSAMEEGSYGTHMY